jgi:hypothetical protein
MIAAQEIGPAAQRAVAIYQRKPRIGGTYIANEIHAPLAFLDFSPRRTVQRRR